MFVVTFVDSLEIPALTKAMLVELLAARMGVNSRKSSELVDAFFELMQERLRSGGEVKLTAFGSFDVRQKAARPGRNPKTGEAILVSPRQVVTFSASPKLKKRMADRRLSEPAVPTPLPRSAVSREGEFALFK
jgi:integration host factor subunit alpha